jgi:hypothetical protein
MKQLLVHPVATQVDDDYFPFGKARSRHMGYTKLCPMENHPVPH